MNNSEMTGARVKLGLVIMLEVLLITFHLGIYSRVFPVGTSEFMYDLPVVGLLFFWNKDVTLADLLSFILAVVTVCLPIVMWFYILTTTFIHSPRNFLQDPVRRLVTTIIAGLYLILVAMEFSMLYLRVQEMIGQGPIPMPGTENASVPMLVTLSIVVIIINTVIGLATARIYVSLSRPGL